MPDYGRWYKRIRISHRLTRDDTVEIMRLGGVVITRNRADAYQRSDDDASRGRKDGAPVRMTEAEFDAFTNGLVTWTRHEPK